MFEKKKCSKFTVVDVVFMWLFIVVAVPVDLLLYSFRVVIQFPCCRSSVWIISMVRIMR
jgi:hypothetical protein